jgi:hypothetical protein
LASGQARYRPCRVSRATAIPRQPKPAGAALVELDGPPRSQEPLVLLGELRNSNGRSGSGSCGLSRPPSWPFAPSPARAFRVFPSRPPSLTEVSDRRPSWPLPLLQSARESAGTASRWFLLSWDSKVALPPAYPPRVHSRGPKLPSDRRCHAPVHVPSSWFRTTSAVSSARRSRVCCTPQPVQGSPRFMLAAVARRPEVASWAGTIPATRF